MNSRNSWKLKFLIVVILLLFVAVAAVGLVVYQKYGSQQAQKDYLLAQTLFEKGQRQQAREILADIYQQHPSFSDREEVIYYLAEISSEESEPKAQGYWETLVSEYPNSEHAPKALTALAKIASASGDSSTSDKYWEQLRQDFPKSEGAAFSLIADANQMAQAGDIEGARKKYYEIIANSPDGKIKGEAMDRLSEINTDYLFSSTPNEWLTLHTVQRGDSLIKIAYKYKTTASFIARANGFDLSKSLIPNQRLAVPTIESYKIIVNKDDLHLYLYSGDGTFMKRYPVGTGRVDHTTPPGEYVIWHKLKQPPWYDREKGRKVMPDDPEYPLGSRWMTLGKADNPDEFSRLGIHGTNEPETIGHRASDGCIRMHNEAVEELYIIVPKGTPVTIVQTQPPPKESAEVSGDEEGSTMDDWLNPQLKQND